MSSKDVALQKSAFEYRSIALLRREKIIFLIKQWPVYDHLEKQKALEIPQDICVHMCTEDHRKIVFRCLYLKLHCLMLAEVPLCPEV